MSLDKTSGKLQVAVIEGAHPFDVPAWHAMFRSFDFMDYYPQPIDNWLADWGQCRNDYDVALFYNMNMDGNDAPLCQNTVNALNAFTEAGGGLLILHHALLSFPENPIMGEIVGLPNRSFTYDPDQDLRVDVASTEHPIARGLPSWTLHDETYKIADARPEDGNEVLFTTDFEKSMHTLGWTRSYNKGRVFCFQPGHDNLVWVVPEFREVIARAIQWLARKI